MKLSTFIFGMALFSVMLIAGVILLTDANSRYVEMQFILQEHMSRHEQLIIGLSLVSGSIVCAILTVLHPWPFVYKSSCVNCHENKTRNRDEKGLAICDDCAKVIWKKELIDKVKDEDILSCPVDGSTMEKLVLNGTEIVIDLCPKCKGAWLNKDETEELEESLGQSRSSGSFSSGMIIGMSLGHM